MTTSGDDSRTELAWREIVENFGERAVLPDDEPTTGRQAPDDAEPVDADTDVLDPPVDASAEADAVADDVDEVAEVDRFRPPTPPPFPRPRTWQRGMAWSGLFVAPVLALVVALFSIYVTPLLWWALLAWFVGGFGYLVREMPRSPRDPWDDGSRV